ncbi:MAG: ATP phosphoribosyltransferase regulatory subunit [Thioalkalispiraceae bacterium]|jgi:ATP phosphoribosyltransferase regulatory subunit
MSKSDRWLLPEGIEEVLPEKARRLEALRRSLLDTYSSWGYELVMPPFIEYLESLLTGTGHDLELQTFKLTDQLTGRMMGVRADMTPQVARIDAHQLKRETPTRLCYMGTVLHTRSDGFAGSRSPLQLGAELYGHTGVESDVEILSLMLETLKLANIERPYLDLGHVGIFRGLAQQAGLSEEQENELFDALQRKATVELNQLVSSWQLDAKVSDMLIALATLNGGEEVLDKAATVLAGATDAVKDALHNLKSIAAQIISRFDVPVNFDLAELRGYNYHTGLVFAAYVPGQGQAVAQGGRYDEIGRIFGRARAATGFSTDLKNLAETFQPRNESSGAIFAPCDDEKSLFQAIAELRQQGERVICELPGQTGNGKDMGCDRQLVKSGDTWQVKNL